MEGKLNQFLKNGSISVSGFLLTHFSQLGINSDELVMLLELKLFRTHNNLFPSADALSKTTGFSEKEVYDLLHELVSKRIIAISKSRSGKDEYSFKLLNDKLEAMLDHSEESQTKRYEINKEKEKTGNERKSVFKKIEQEFGRPLSPMELETINQWFDVDHYSPELISLALKESVLSQVYNLKYMDRILLNWQSKNIKTAAQVEDANKQRQDSFKTTKPNQQQKDGPKIPMFKLDQ